MPRNREIPSIFFLSKVCAAATQSGEIVILFMTFEYMASQHTQSNNNELFTSSSNEVFKIKSFRAPGIAMQQKSLITLIVNHHICGENGANIFFLSSMLTNKGY